MRSNLGGNPQANNFDSFGEYSFSGKLSYNRTPLFEYIFGRRIFDWFSVAISYQTQGHVSISTPYVNPTIPPRANSNFSNPKVGFLANFRVDSIMPKFYFHSPWSWVFLRILSNPYLAVSVGPGWQSWTRIDLNRPALFTANNIQTQFDQALNQKISANFVWSVDVGGVQM